MKPHPRQEEQDDLLRPRLTDMIDMRHELAKLAALIDWDFFEREWAGFFPSHRGRPATSPRLVAGLLYLQHAFRLSDEAVVACPSSDDLGHEGLIGNGGSGSLMVQSMPRADGAASGASRSSLP